MRKRVIRIPIIVPIIIVFAITIIMTYVLRQEMITNSARYIETNASTTEDGKFEYEILEDGTVEITYYIEEEEIIEPDTEIEVIIPESIDGKMVTSIGENAFRWSFLTSIVIPEGITNIGVGTFDGCIDLKEINVAEENKNYQSENGILFNKEKNKIICYPAGKEETQYTIPNTVTSLESLAFSWSNLESIIISENLEKMGDNVFEWCTFLKEISVNSNNKVYSSENGVLFNIGKTTLICYPAGKQETQYTIPESVTTIGKYAFSNCMELVNIVIPTGVTSIGENAFYDCTNLDNIEIPEGITSLGDYVFYACEALKEVNIPSSVTSIGDSTFSRCISLNNITIPQGVTSVGSFAFSGCTNLKDITILGNEINIEYGVFYDSEIKRITANKEIELPDIIKRAIDEEDTLLYSEEGLEFTNCALSEDKTKLIVNEEVTNEEQIRLSVISGALNGLAVVVFESGTITYNVTELTDGEVIATLHIADGERITNNDGKNTYTFTANGEFQFEYIDINGETRTVIAKVENITSELPSILEVTSENYNIDDENISDVRPQTSVTEFKKELVVTNGTEINIYNKEQQLLANNDKVATGMQAEFKLGNITRTCTIVVTGDLNGDSEMNDIDLLRMARYKAGLDKNLSGAYLKAADIYKDNNLADDIDLLKMVRILIGLDTL